MHCVDGEAWPGLKPHKNMMERRYSLPSMVRLDPAVIMKNSALLKAAKRSQHPSREKSSPRLEKKAISFDLDNNLQHAKA